VRVDEDFAPYIRNIRNGLIPCLKDARRTGHIVFLRKDELVVNGRHYDLAYLLKSWAITMEAVGPPGAEPRAGRRMNLRVRWDQQTGARTTGESGREREREEFC
jgi:hypothetical protein